MTGNTANANRMMPFALRWFPHGGGPAEKIVAVFVWMPASSSAL
nr:hypothetical protein [Rhodococcus opacus]